MKKALVLFLLLSLCIYQFIKYDTLDQNPYLITDYSRLHPVKVERIVKGKEEEQLIQLLQEAQRNNLTISIAGQRHSQGGHTFYKDGIVVDMTPYNRILSFDPKGKQIRIQAGGTWEDIQNEINPYGLAVKTMQSQNVFTIGGSISVNAHGRDIRNGSMIESVQSFRLLMADGQVKKVSRTENSDLFSLALGGYGLFGIILDVTLSLTDDEVYTTQIDETTVEEYSSYFQREVKSNSAIHMHIARISVAPDSFLTEMYAVNYQIDPSLPLEQHNKLKTKESGVIPSKLLFHINRSSDWGKNLFWKLQSAYFSNQNDKVISRNNVMRSESQFMEYRQVDRNDVLQEYFVPIKEFAPFIDSLKQVLNEEDLNLLNVSVRYVNEDQEAVLSYAQDEMFALVCLFNVSLSDEDQIITQRGIQRVLDEVIEHHGTYYLPYVAYPSLEQFRTVYPRYQQFFDKKDEYDPQHRFMNYFYEQYKGE
jgi:decaprenylphospho-beta-D-ribofuranose 2-oxidase